MKYFAVMLLILCLAILSFAQDPDGTVAKKTAEEPLNLVKPKQPKGEKEEFESAVSNSLAEERIRALKKFIEDYPKSDYKLRAAEAIASSRAEIADEKLRYGDVEEGVKFFKLAVEEAPTPFSNKLFSGVLVKLPANLFFRGQRKAALEVAKMIEERVAENPKHLLGLATFYLSVESADDAKRLAEKSLELEESSAAFYTIGFAHRLNFDLEKAEESFSKAVEVDPTSIRSKLSLGEMKRARGKPEEAELLYRDIFTTEPTNSMAKTGLILALFDSGKRLEAETMLAPFIEENPKNLALLVGIAYWYAAQNEGARALEFSKMALDIEPRYTWSYIAMARGFMAEGDPVAAERTLLTAQQYGNFPTLEYELASARMAAGFYREAAEGLGKSFTIKDNLISTKLGGRVKKEADSFHALLSEERRAGIFQFLAADSPANFEGLKKLMLFRGLLETNDSTEEEIETAADDFVSGEDTMKFHRQLFVATRLLEKRRSLGKVLELAKDSVNGVDTALKVATPSAAVLAEELYESKRIASSRGETIIVPEIPRQTLSRIIRGRIEEISGWALFQQEKNDEAIARLKLASTVLPKDSAWSRSTMWKLGTVLESQGKQKEALEAYIKGYVPGERNSARKLVIENLYAKVNGSLDGLEEKLTGNSVEKSSASIFTKKPKDETQKPDEEKIDSGKVSDENDAGSVSSDEVSKSIPDPVPPIEIPSKKPEDLKIDKEKSSNAKTEEKSGNKEVETENLSFKPVVIGISKTEEKSEAAKKNTADEKTAKSDKPLQDTDKKSISDESVDAKSDADPPKEKVDEKPVSDPGVGLKERDRIVKTDDQKTSANKEDSKALACKIEASQEEVSIINGGGSIGVMVHLPDNEVELKEIKAVSESPDDVEVVFEPEIGALSGKAFFVVKSVTSKTGEFKVSFNAPCGKKEILVKVR